MISHKHQCIFIHLPKTGGKSLKKILFDIPELGPNSEDWQGVHPPDYYVDPFGHHRLSDYRKLPCYRRYFRFTIVRNPYDRLVSAFQYLNKGGSNKFDQTFYLKYLRRYNGDFKSFVYDFHHQFESHLHFKSQYTWTQTFWRKVPLDYVGRFEQFDEACRFLTKKISGREAQCVHINKSDRRPYQEYYDEECRMLVQKVYRKDLKVFGYEF